MFPNVLYALCQSLGTANILLPKSYKQIKSTEYLLQCRRDTSKEVVVRKMLVIVQARYQDESLYVYLPIPLCICSTKNGVYVLNTLRSR